MSARDIMQSLVDELGFDVDVASETEAQAMFDAMLERLGPDGVAALANGLFADVSDDDTRRITNDVLEQWS